MWDNTAKCMGCGNIVELGRDHDCEGSPLHGTCDEVRCPCHSKLVEALKVVEAGKKLRASIMVDDDQQFNVVGDHFALTCMDFDDALAPKKEPAR